MKPIRQGICVALLCWALAMGMAMLSWALIGLFPGEETPDAPESCDISPVSPESTPASSPPAAAAREAIRWDESTVFPVLWEDGSIRETTMAAFLPGVLAGEMPASFEMDALRAQAVAARTFILAAMGTPRGAHPAAVVCTDPGCCQAWCSEAALRARWGADYNACRLRVVQAVQDTDGTCLTWEGQPILACFHASSLRCTEDSGNVWSASLPYLVSVSSPESTETVPGLVTTVSVSAGELRRAVESVSVAVFPDDPAQWIGAVARDAAGRVSGVMLGGAYLSGTRLRSLFALRSTDFTLCWTGQEFLFTVAGHGHGVGMSQYGAELMAREGQGWEDILAHYYPGAVPERYGA